MLMNRGKREGLLPVSKDLCSRRSIWKSVIGLGPLRKRRDGIHEDVDPGKLSVRCLCGIVGRQPVRNRTRLVTRTPRHQQRKTHQFPGPLHSLSILHTKTIPISLPPHKKWKRKGFIF